MVMMVGLDVSWRMTFCSVTGTFRIRRLGLGSPCFLATFVKPLSGPLGAATWAVTCAQELVAKAVVVGVGAGMPCSWVIVCWR